MKITETMVSANLVVVVKVEVRVKWARKWRWVWGNGERLTVKGGKKTRG